MNWFNRNIPCNRKWYCRFWSWWSYPDFPQRLLWWGTSWDFMVKQQCIFYTDSQKESLYIVFASAFLNLEYFSVWSLCLSFCLSLFVCLCVRTFLDPWLKKSINQLFTGAGTLTFLILELEKFWRQFWKSQIKRRQSIYVVFMIFTIFCGSRR